MTKIHDRTMQILAEPTRRRIVELLAEHPRRVNDIAQALDMSGPATSRHLKVLRQGGVVEDMHPEDDARVRVYRLRPEPFAELHAWVERIESFWAIQLEAFNDHVDTSRGGE